MTARSLTFTEFVDFVLVRLYERDGEGYGVNVGEIAAELAEPVPLKWVQQAVEVLQQLGWARDLGLDTGWFAEITGSGRLYVEGREHRTDVIEQYKEHPANIVIVGGAGHNVAVGVSGDVTQTIGSGDRERALEILGQIRDVLAQDASLSVEAREDALADVDAMEAQLGRHTLNRAAIAPIIASLAGLASVGQLALQLAQAV